MSEFKRLAHLCEIAPSPSDALQFAIGKAVGTVKYGAPFQADGTGVRLCPAYTHSIEAAITLVPDDCQWSFDSHYSIAEVHRYWTPSNAEDSGHARYMGEAATPALALTAACLRAMVE